MSFYVDDMLTALQIGLKVIGRADLAALPDLAAIEAHPDVERKDGQMTNICDVEGKFAKKTVYLHVNMPDGKTEAISSSPFRDGFDVALQSPKDPSIFVRWNP